MLNTLEEFLEALKANDVTRVKELLRTDPSFISTRTRTGASPLLLATYYGRKEIVQALVDAGAPMDIFEASAAGNLARVQQVVSDDPNAVNEFAPDGFQPLGLAAFFGHTEIARFLLEQGAEVNSASNNAQRVMPLHSAVASQYLEITRALLEHGADVNAKQQDDFTPLMEAAQNGQLEMVKLLLRYNPDVNVTKADGKSALDLAREYGHADIVELLRSRTQDRTHV